MCEPFYKRMLDPIDSVLKKAGYEKKDINKVLILGGSSKLANVRDKVEEYFDYKVKILYNDKPDEAVARGAAYLAFIRTNPNDESIC